MFFKVCNDIFLVSTFWLILQNWRSLQCNFLRNHFSYFRATVLPKPDWVLRLVLYSCKRYHCQQKEQFRNEIFSSMTLLDNCKSSIYEDFDTVFASEKALFWFVSAIWMLYHDVIGLKNWISDRRNFWTRPFSPVSF